MPKIAPFFNIIIKFSSNFSMLDPYFSLIKLLLKILTLIVNLASTLEIQPK